MVPHRKPSSVTVSLESMTLQQQTHAADQATACLPWSKSLAWQGPLAGFKE
jgi:hypothetical protein